MDFQAEDWHNAVVPGTVLGSLVGDGTVKDPYFGINMKQIDFPKSVRAVGEYKVIIKLSSKLKPELTIKVVSKGQK